MCTSTVILAIIIIVAFLFFLWFVFRLDDEPSPYDDNCGNPVVVTPIPQSKEHRNFLKDSLNKFCQAEHEIDTLCRSYIIERLCSCCEAENTFQRMEHLCDRSGDYLAVSSGTKIGSKYSQLRRESCHHLRRCLDDDMSSNDLHQQMGNLLHQMNPNISADFIARIRLEHCRLMERLVQAHTNKDSLSAMVIYDSMIEKTDSYVENIYSVMRKK